MLARRLLALATIPLLIIALDGCRRRGAKAKDYARQLAPGEYGLVEVDIDRLPLLSLTTADRAAIKQAIANSQTYLGKRSSQVPYPVSGISHAQVVRSLQVLAELMDSTASDAELNDRLRTRFRAFMSVGCDNEGTVLFTGYYTPIFAGSRTPDATHRWPLYRRPADLVSGKGDERAQQQLPDGSMRPYPTRSELESSGVLRGSELIWLTDPFEAYIIQVQGSGRIRLPDGQLIEVGYDGTNNLPYAAIGHALIEDKKITAEELSLATLRRYFKAHPDDLQRYAAGNQRYVFFRETSGGPFGSIGQPVTTDVTVATDKAIFPPGAPLVVATRSVGRDGHTGPYAGVRLDQDTGGAIRAPGRCDLYMGVGDGAEQRAGNQLAEGRMYYLIARD